jgi:hypothetical protein
LEGLCRLTETFVYLKGREFRTSSSLGPLVRGCPVAHYYMEVARVVFELLMLQLGAL